MAALPVPCLGCCFGNQYLRASSVPAGVQALFLEVKEIWKIKSKMSRQRLSTQQLPYRDMERLRQVRPVLLLCLPGAPRNAPSPWNGAGIPP